MGWLVRDTHLSHSTSAGGGLYTCVLHTVLKRDVAQKHAPLTTVPPAVVLHAEIVSML